jgi:hypothetical protein
MWLSGGDKITDTLESRDSIVALQNSVSVIEFLNNEAPPKMDLSPVAWNTRLADLILLYSLVWFTTYNIGCPMPGKGNQKFWEEQIATFKSTRPTILLLLRVNSLQR